MSKRGWNPNEDPPTSNQTQFSGKKMKKSKKFRGGPNRGGPNWQYPATNHHERFLPDQQMASSRYNTPSGHPASDRRYPGSGWPGDDPSSQHLPQSYDYQISSRQSSYNYQSSSSQRSYDYQSGSNQRSYDYQSGSYQRSYDYQSSSNQSYDFRTSLNQSYERRQTYDPSLYSSMSHHRTGYNEFPSQQPRPDYGQQSLDSRYQSSLNQFSSQAGLAGPRKNWTSSMGEFLNPIQSQKTNSKDSDGEDQFDQTRKKRSASFNPDDSESRYAGSVNDNAEVRLRKGDSFVPTKNVLGNEDRGMTNELKTEETKRTKRKKERKKRTWDKVKKARQETLRPPSVEIEVISQRQSPSNEEIIPSSSGPNPNDASSRLSFQSSEAVDSSQEFVSPGNYLTVAFDAYVWTEENLRMEHLCQLGAASSQRESFFRWIFPAPSNASQQHFPFLDDFKGGYSFHFGYNQIQKVDSFVTTRKGLEDFVEFLETGCRKMGPDCDGVLLMSFRRNVIPCLIMSMLDHDDLKVRFADLVKGVGDLRTYLLQCPDLIDKFHGNDSWQDELSSIHTASRLIFGEYPTTNGQCDLNSKTLLNMLYKLVGFYEPPTRFVQRYFIPLRSSAVRTLILERNLARKVGKFWQLQVFVSSRLAQTASDLVPVGVFNELAPERPGLLSDRLSAGLVRALIAAGLEFESLQDLMVSAGVKGFEDDLLNLFLPKDFSNQAEIAHQQTIRIVKLASLFFQQNTVYVRTDSRTMQHVRKELPSNQSRKESRTIQRVQKEIPLNQSVQKDSPKIQTVQKENQRQKTFRKNTFKTPTVQNEIPKTQTEQKETPSFQAVRNENSKTQTDQVETPKTQTVPEESPKMQTVQKDTLTVQNETPNTQTFQKDTPTVQNETPNTQTFQKDTLTVQNETPNTQTVQKDTPTVRKETPKTQTVRKGTSKMQTPTVQKESSEMLTVKKDTQKYQTVQKETPKTPAIQKDTQKLSTAQRETPKVPPPPILRIKEIEKSDEMLTDKKDTQKPPTVPKETPKTPAVQKETQKLTTAQRESLKVPPPPILSIKEIEKSDEIFDNFFNDLEKEFRTWFGTSPELEKVVRIFVDYLEKAKIGGRR